MSFKAKGEIRLGMDGMRMVGGMKLKDSVRKRSLSSLKGP
jgi:hypothetical protein